MLGGRRACEFPKRSGHRRSAARAIETQRDRSSTTWPRACGAFNAHPYGLGDQPAGVTAFTRDRSKAVCGLWHKK
jgi:hypothetical protein